MANRRISQNDFVKQISYCGIILGVESFGHFYVVPTRVNNPFSHKEARSLDERLKNYSLNMTVTVQEWMNGPKQSKDKGKILRYIFWRMLWLRSLHVHKEPPLFQSGSHSRGILKAHLANLARNFRANPYISVLK